MKLKVFPQDFAICRLNAESSIPEWAKTSRPFFCLQTEKDLSLVCDEVQVPPEVTSDGSWRCFEVEGPIEPDMTGFIANISVALANEGVSIFWLTSFDSDFVFVRDHSFEVSKEVFADLGYQIDS